MIRRGDIRWFRFFSPDKRRPVLVLGRDDLLPTLAQVPVIPLSTQIRGLGWEVVLTENDGVPAPCTLKPEWIKSVGRAAIGPRLGALPASRWLEVRAALLDILGLATQPLD